MTGNDASDSFWDWAIDSVVLAVLVGSGAAPTRESRRQMAERATREFTEIVGRVVGNRRVQSLSGPDLRLVVEGTLRRALELIEEGQTANAS